MEIENGILKEVKNEDISNGSFVIPDNVTSIGDDAFWYCTSLTNLIIPKKVTSIGDWAFDGCFNLTSVTIPDSVTSIGDYAFFYCTSLASVNIPDSVTSIGRDAFYKCGALTSVTIPASVRSIGDWAFAYCSSLTSVTIGDGVTSIGDYAFSGCAALTNVMIGSGVTSIGNGAFIGCTSLLSEKNNYKAFKRNMKCLDYQYKVGKWSVPIDDIQICERGYHFCTNLFDIFNYYYGDLNKDIKIAVCEVGDKRETDDRDSKHVTNKIKPIKILSRQEILDILNGGEKMGKNLSERVFLYRAKHDLSMREFAPLVGLTSVTQVWRIEQCKISRRREAMLNLKMDELERKDENAESN